MSSGSTSPESDARVCEVAGPIGSPRSAAPTEERPARSAAKAWLTWAGKLGATAVLLWFALRRVPFADLKHAFTNLNAGLALLAIALFQPLVISLESARFWASGAQVNDPSPGVRRWVRLYVESRPFVYLLPASVGAEGLIWVRLHQLRWNHASCALVVLVTRLWGLAGWAILASVSLARGPELASILAGLPAWFASPLIWAVGGVAAVLIAAAAPALASRIRGVSLARDWPVRALLLALLSVVCAFAAGFASKLAADAAGTPMSYLTLLGLLALFNFATALPISFGGIGIQELLILRLGTSMGYHAAPLLAFSALLHAQRVVLALVGLPFFLRGASPRE